MAYIYSVKYILFQQKADILIMKQLTFIFSLLILTHLLDSIFPPKDTVMDKTHLSVTFGISKGNTNINTHMKVDKNFGIINTFIAWEDDFPITFAKYIKEKNKILILTWEPYIKTNKQSNILPDIISGKYDALIRNMAKSFKTYNSPCFLRWGHEMNGNWYSWSGNPDQYIKAYERIYNIFKNENCDNVKFIFSINNFDVPHKKENKFELYYPGDKFVDIIGIDGYNWGKEKSKMKWKSASQIFSNSYHRIKHMAPDKPIFITETGTTSRGGDKIDWILDFLKTLKTKFKSVKAVIWFDINKESDWSLTKDKVIFNSYLNYINNDKYFSKDSEKLYWIFELRNN